MFQNLSARLHDTRTIRSQKKTSARTLARIGAHFGVLSAGVVPSSHLARCLFHLYTAGLPPSASLTFLLAPLEFITCF